MEGLITFLVLLCLSSPSLGSRNNKIVYLTSSYIKASLTPPYMSVTNFGAVGDGKTDDTQAFLKAWEAVCGASGGIPTLSIPNGKTFLLQPLQFEGPCKSPKIQVEFKGIIVAPQGMQQWKGLKNFENTWISFNGIDSLRISGGGTIDGKGAEWWQNCKHNCESPTALRFTNCKNLRLFALHHINSPRNHISISGCDGSILSNLQIVAPEMSPNTDGIDISHSTNVQITSSLIATGDDCIAINDASSFINISEITCGPGHGISIGSLGKDGQFNTVEEINVKNCTFKRTQNGVRIKTWPGGTGYARRIKFVNIRMEAAQNPIIIDQFYLSKVSDSVKGKAVKVSDVLYGNIRGTSADGNAITLNCDKYMPCTNIIMQKIHIAPSSSGVRAGAFCSSAIGRATRVMPQVPCLESR